MLHQQDNVLFQSLANLPDIVTDKEMERQLEKARKVAPWNNINVLILGSTGTDKEEFARLVHDWNEKRKDKHFVTINCAAIPDTQVESELFGTKIRSRSNAINQPGTFQMANGGTLFMDEIGGVTLHALCHRLQVPVARSVHWSFRA